MTPKNKHTIKTFHLLSIVDCIVLFWLNSGNKIEIKLNWKLNTWDMIRKIDFYKNNKRRIEWKDCYLK